ncbi:MAG: dephospho-CoA kinase [Gemmatimonadota bacterium]
MLRVGLTGNVASGKSSVVRAWLDEGAHVIDADRLARDAVAPGSSGLRQVRDAFGDEVMDGDTLDRAALRRRVFDDDEVRRRLEAIVHPEVARLRAAAEARLREAGADLVVHDIPLLFEVGLEHEFDVIVLVDAPADVREERLVRYRGLARDEARAMIDAQMPAAPKRDRADIVIENDGTMAELRERAARVWRELRSRADGTGPGDAPGGTEAGGVATPVGEAAGEAARGRRRIRVDMHVHTRGSFDCVSDPGAVVEQAARAGLDRVCVTDHDRIHVALELAERYPDRVVPGEEVRTAEGADIIGLYLHEWIPKGTPARETCERIRAQGGLVYVPHPFAGGKGRGGAILPELEGLVDVVEVFNARIHRQALNDRAREWARARGLAMGAGSDAHTLGEIGNAFVEVPACHNEPSAFLEALRSARVHGTEATVFVHLASTLAKLVP